MQAVPTNYLIVTQAVCYPISASSFAVESAFAEHLRRLAKLWSGHFRHLVIVAPVMSEAVYEARRDYWGTLHAEEDGISLVPMHPMPVSPAEYWFRHLPRNIRKLNAAIKSAGIVHSGPSHLYFPFGCIALLIATISHRPTIFVQDIDERRSAWMCYKTDRWSLKSYLLSRFIYSPFIALQTWLAARFCTLTLLKGAQLVKDFGRGRPTVRNFMDSAFSLEQVIRTDELEQKISRLRDPLRPLELVYFGRLTAYKGLDRSIAAVAMAMQNHGANLRLHVIGTGEEEKALRSLTVSLGIAAAVVFHGAVPFGPQLFKKIYQFDLLLATPLSEDTPRNAFDALASGIPILAFDTYYYKDLQCSGAVDVVPWPSVDDLASRIAARAADKRSLESAMRSGVSYARENTQDIWLRRRYEWTLEGLATHHY